MLFGQDCFNLILFYPSHDFLSGWQTKATEEEEKQQPLLSGAGHGAGVPGLRHIQDHSQPGRVVASGESGAV